VVLAGLLTMRTSVASGASGATLAKLLSNGEASRMIQSTSCFARSIQVTITVEQFIGGVRGQVTAGQQEEVAVAVAQGFEVVRIGAVTLRGTREPLVQRGGGWIALHHEHAAALMAEGGGECGGNERFAFTGAGAGDENDAGWSHCGSSPACRACW
jgi:hypothetical protein